MKLSKNFSLSEFTRSVTASKMGITNNPGLPEIENLTRLANRLLQPLRNLYGKPFYINSGYRSYALNTAVGGVAISQHTKGEAADVRVEDPRKLLSILQESNLAFDQAILYPTFLHLSYKLGNNRKQVLAAKGVIL